MEQAVLQQLIEKHPKVIGSSAKVYFTYIFNFFPFEFNCNSSVFWFIFTFPSLFVFLVFDFLFGSVDVIFNQLIQFLFEGEYH